MQEAALPELITVKEAAEYLKVSERYVYTLCREDVLPFVRVGTHYRIIRNQILVSLQKAFAIPKE